MNRLTRQMALATSLSLLPITTPQAALGPNNFNITDLPPGNPVTKTEPVEESMTFLYNALTLDSLSSFAGMPVLPIDIDQFLPSDLPLLELDEDSQIELGNNLRDYMWQNAPFWTAEFEASVRATMPEITQPYIGLIEYLNEIYGSSGALLNPDAMQYKDLCLVHASNDAMMNPSMVDALTIMLASFECSGEYDEMFLLDNQLFKISAFQAVLGATRDFSFPQVAVEEFVAHQATYGQNLGLGIFIAAYLDAAGIRATTERQPLVDTLIAQAMAFDTDLTAKGDDIEAIASYLIETANGQPGIRAAKAYMTMQVLDKDILAAHGYQPKSSLRDYVDGSIVTSRVAPKPALRLVPAN